MFNSCRNVILFISSRSQTGENIYFLVLEIEYKKIMKQTLSCQFNYLSIWCFKFKHDFHTRRIIRGMDLMVFLMEYKNRKKYIDESSEWQKYCTNSNSSCTALPWPITRQSVQWIADMFTHTHPWFDVLCFIKQFRWSLVVNAVVDVCQFWLK